MPMSCAPAPEPAAATPRNPLPMVGLIGPQNSAEVAIAQLMVMNHMLTSGRVPPRDVPPHQLTAAELIDFWADHRMAPTPQNTQDGQR